MAFHRTFEKKRNIAREEKQVRQQKEEAEEFQELLKKQVRVCAVSCACAIKPQPHRVNPFTVRVWSGGHQSRIFLVAVVSCGEGPFSSSGRSSGCSQSKLTHTMMLCTY